MLEPWVWKEGGYARLLGPVAIKRRKRRPKLIAAN